MEKGVRKVIKKGSVFIYTNSLGEEIVLTPLRGMKPDEMGVIVCKSGENTYYVDAEEPEKFVSAKHVIVEVYETKRGYMGTDLGQIDDCTDTFINKGARLLLLKKVYDKIGYPDKQ